MALDLPTITIATQRTSTHSTQHYEYNEPFFAVVLEGIPWIFTDTKDERLTAANLGSGYSAYTLKPYIKELPLNLNEKVNFFNFSAQGPGTMSVCLADVSSELSLLFSQSNTLKTKLSAAATSTATSISVISTAACTQSADTVIYCEKETLLNGSATSTSYAGTTIGSFRGQFGSTAEALSSGAVVSLYPRFWKGRKATVLYGDLKAPSSAVTLFRGVVAGLRERQLGEFELSIDDALRLSARPIFDNMRAKLIHKGSNQISVFVPYGERLPKRPDDFQTTYRGGEYGVFPQFDNNLAQHFLFVENGDKSDYFSFQRGTPVAPTSGTTTSCEVMPVINGDFDDWNFEIIRDLTEDEYANNATSGHIQTKVARFTPMGWVIDGDSLQVQGTYDGQFEPTDVANVFYSPTGYIAPAPGCQKDDSYDGHIHSSKNISLGFKYGSIGAALRASTFFTVFTDDDLNIVYRERADASLDYHIVLQDTSTNEFYQWDGTWSSTSNQKTVTANTSLNWNKITQSVTIDRPRPLKLTFGNVAANGSVIATTSAAFYIDDVVVDIDNIYDSTFAEYGPAVVTFYNTRQTGSFSQSAQEHSYESTIDFSRNPAVKETMVLRGSPVAITSALLRSVDGNATDVYDTIPASWCLGLTASEVDQNSLDFFGRSYSGPGTITLFIKEPFNALEYLQKNVFTPSASWLAVRNAKISCVGLSSGLTDYVASSSGGSFAAAATSSDFRGYTEAPVYSSGSEYICNQIKANIFLKAPELRTGIPPKQMPARAKFIVNATGDSAACFGQGLNPVEYESDIYTADSFGTQIIAIASRWFQRFSLGMPYYTFETDFSVADTLFIGDIIKITMDNIYNPATGARGVTSKTCWLWSKSINFGRRTITWSASPQPPDANPGYIAPALNVVSNAATVVTVSAAQYSSGYDVWGNVDKDIYHMPDTGSLKYHLYKPSTGDSQLGTYSAISYAGNTITLDSVPAWIAAGCVITLSTYSAFAAGDEGIAGPRVFLADSATGIITGSTRAMTYA